MIIELSNHQIRQLIKDGEIRYGQVIIRRIPAVEDDTPEVRLRE